MPYLRYVALVLLAFGLASASAEAQAPSCPCSLWPAFAEPLVADSGDGAAIEVGVKFSPQVDGEVIAIRFYKAAANAGPHVGNLWTAAGALVGSVVFSNESGAGWQEARFPHPLQLTAGTVYVASYSAPTGHYAFSPDYFTTPRTSGTLVALDDHVSPNGVFAYGNGGFPNTSFKSSNYWVDVVFVPNGGLGVLQVMPVPDAIDAAPPITASFLSDMNGSSIVLTLQDADGATVDGTVTYLAETRTVRFTPRRLLKAKSKYTATVEAATDAEGRPLPAPYSWSFTTGLSGFRDSIVIAGLVNPVSVQFLPSGHVFVAEKSGIIKVFEGLDDQTPTVFADLRTQVHNFWDRGLLGLAVAPDFPTHPYVYVSYTHDAPKGGTAPVYGTAGVTSDGCAGGDGNCPASGRLSRLHAIAAPGGYVSGVEEVLIEDWPQQFSSHSMGALSFGPDGALYMSGGEGAGFTFVDYGQGGNPPNPLGDPPTGSGLAPTPPAAEGGALRAQSLQRANGPALLNGTIIRVDPATGGGLPDNPLASHADGNARRIVAQGFRNPFRFTFRPGTREIWVGDVGWEEWEEINRVPDPTARVTNFGWPCFEGPQRQPGYEGANLAICQGLYAQPAAVTAPYFAYRRLEQVVPGEPCAAGGSSTTGLAFYEGGNYPDLYKGALFLADYSRGCIWVVLSDEQGVPDPARRATFLSGARAPVELRIGPDGDLFYVDVSGGTIRRISYVPLAGDAPQARAVATPSSGKAPLSVQFDATESTGGGHDGLTYTWNFGDGSPVLVGGPGQTHTYTTGTYVAALTVRDTAGQASTVTVQINVDNNPPTPIIETPATNRTWSVGDTLTFSGRATDVEEGALDASRLTWTFTMEHCSDVAGTCHKHQLQDFVGVSSGSFVAPDHDYPSYLELTLTARDSAGLTSTVTQRLDPKTVDLSFDTAPSGLSITVGSKAGETPFSRRVIMGSIVSISTPKDQIKGVATYAFSRWSDGGLQTHEIEASEGSASYVASFAPLPSGRFSFFTTADHPTVPDSGPDSAVELGLKFRATREGNVVAIRFHKSAANTGNHVGSLWTADGTPLGSVTFSGETPSGWQQAEFPAPIHVSPGATYVISYHTTTGHYGYNHEYFATPLYRGPLHADGGAFVANGVFGYGPAVTFPTQSFNASNYWVDVVFDTGPDTGPPAVVATTPAANATGVSVTSAIRASFSEFVDPESVTPSSMQVLDPTGAIVPGTVMCDPGLKEITFTPSHALAALSRYTVKVIGGSATTSVRDAADNILPADVVWSFETAPPPTMAVTRPALNFGAVTNAGSGATVATAFASVTGAQLVQLKQNGSGTVTWTASSDQPWLKVSPAAGTGSATLSVSVVFSETLPPSGQRPGTITIAFVGAASSSQSIGVTLDVMPGGTGHPPIGSFDTPLDGAQGLTGSVAVSGWVVDDVEVARVRLLRDPVPGEGSALVFVGNAALVEGSRPDVTATFPTLPRSTRAGWGYLLLTNFLPNHGNGTFRLHAIADDVDGHSTPLGFRTITCTNSSATRPFGAIDTPSQGETIGGTIYNSFGWVLSLGARRADPPGGGSVDVMIDGIVVGSPTGWTNRADLSQLFPVEQYAGVGTAAGVYSFNPSQFADGVHTIAWIVKDNQGETDGVGSRYFTITSTGLPQAAVGRTVWESITPAAPVVTVDQSSVGSGGPLREDLAAAPLDRSNISVQRGYDLQSSAQQVGPADSDRFVVPGEELDRFEIRLGEVDGQTYSGYLRVAGELNALPIGSRLEPSTGLFTWQPGAGFIGTYDFVFVRWIDGNARDRREIRIVLHAKGSNRVGPQVVIDTPDARADVAQPFLLAGWASDLDAAIGTGVDTVHVWAYPVSGGEPFFLGAATYGGHRPDVGAVFGGRFLASGYGLTVQGLEPGTYDLAVFAWSTVKGGFVPARTVRVSVR